MEQWNNGTMERSAGARPECGGHLSVPIPEGRFCQRPDEKKRHRNYGAVELWDQA